MSKTILVVGGTGMLGEPVARRMRADGYQVRIFTRNVEKARAKFGAEYEVAAGAVCPAGSRLRQLALSSTKFLRRVDNAFFEPRLSWIPHCP